MGDATDVELVERARDGDQEALDALLRRHHDRIAALCHRMCGNAADAADATQEALIAIVRGLSRFDGRAAFSTWAYRVTTNACLDELRRRSRRPVSGLEAEGPDLAARATRDVADAVAAGIDVDTALAALPLEFRTAVVLRDLCGLDYAEMAEVLDIPAGTVRSRIARGRGQLADRLAGNHDGSERRPTSQP
ncbi:MAG TPA: sigma-70 family RNA polymerase sigma factor [Acidimicrobiales bacterium]|nr:sigma-70 family RNA polymerase sigma factor [Acidimicrobiales bacterium]